jgi:hypothetical protein
MLWYDFDRDGAKIPRITRIKFREDGTNGDVEEIILQSNTTGTNKTIETFRIVKAFRERGTDTYITKPAGGGENSRLVFAFDTVFSEPNSFVLAATMTENGVETKTSKFILAGRTLIRGLKEFLKPAPRPVVPPPPLPKIKVPKGQEDAITNEEITEGMEMVDFNKQREDKHLYYTKSSYQQGVVALGNRDPYTRLPVKPDTVVNYIAEIDPNMPVVGGRRTRIRQTRRRTLRRKQVRGTKTY